MKSSENNKLEEEIRKSQEEEQKRVEEEKIRKENETAVQRWKVPQQACPMVDALEDFIMAHSLLTTEEKKAKVDSLVETLKQHQYQINREGPLALTKDQVMYQLKQAMGLGTMEYRKYSEQYEGLCKIIDSLYYHLLNLLDSPGLKTHWSKEIRVLGEQCDEIKKTL